MIRLQGSKIVQIECRDCSALSPPFRVYFYDEYTDKHDIHPEHYWEAKSPPEEWEVEEEEDLEENGKIWGYCPTHRT